MHAYSWRLQHRGQIKQHIIRPINDLHPFSVYLPPFPLTYSPLFPLLIDFLIDIDTAPRQAVTYPAVQLLRSHLPPSSTAPASPPSFAPPPPARFWLPLPHVIAFLFCPMRRPPVREARAQDGRWHPYTAIISRRRDPTTGRPQLEVQWDDSFVNLDDFPDVAQARRMFRHMGDSGRNARARRRAGEAVQVLDPDPARLPSPPPPYEAAPAYRPQPRPAPVLPALPAPSSRTNFSGAQPPPGNTRRVTAPSQERLAPRSEASYASRISKRRIPIDETRSLPKCASITPTRCRLPPLTLAGHRSLLHPITR